MSISEALDMEPFEVVIDDFERTLNHYGELNPFWGQKHTEEYKKEKSANRLEYYKTEQGKKQIEQIRKTLKDKGFKPPMNTHTKHQKWWNNGVVNTRAIECPEGFVAGRIKGQWGKNL